MKCYVWLVKVERSILGSGHVVVASVYVEKTRPSASGKYIFYEEQCIRYYYLIGIILKKKIEMCMAIGLTHCGLTKLCEAKYICCYFSF